MVPKALRPAAQLPFKPIMIFSLVENQQVLNSFLFTGEEKWVSEGCNINRYM